ncbi:MAG: hypothetical protein HZC55_04290 [Verrucomicrobia bacterium]|nr:hypothetical protein [Verrucomicrobiota bacterium]
MAEVQLELPVPSEPKPNGPSATADQVATVINFLRGRDWTLRRVIEAETGLSDRIIRAAAKAGRPRIVSAPGSAGYKLWENCTTEELHQCMERFRSQRDDMGETYLVMHRAFHGGYRGGE